MCCGTDLARDDATAAVDDAVANSSSRSSSSAVYNRPIDVNGKGRGASISRPHKVSIQQYTTASAVH